MPYIPQDRRVRAVFGPCDAGELNFAITKLITSYLQFKGTRYATFNDIIGALEGAKLELYRRVVGPYETQKAIENGDVYGERE